MVPWSAYNLVIGRTLTAYPVLKADMERGGASYQDKEVVVDGNLVTSRASIDRLRASHLSIDHS